MKTRADNIEDLVSIPVTPTPKQRRERIDLLKAELLNPVRYGQRERFFRLSPSGLAAGDEIREHEKALAEVS